MRDAVARQDSLLRGLLPASPFGAPRVPVVIGGSLTSGIAPISKTVDSHRSGAIATYRDIIAMTKLDGWK